MKFKLPMLMLFLKKFRPTFEGNPQDSEMYNASTHSNSTLGVKAHPNYKFVWNSFLLKPVESVFHSDWILFVTKYCFCY